jgi:hypothetical protein
VALASPLGAQEKPYTQAGTGQPPVPPVPAAPPASPQPVAETKGLEKFFGTQIPEAIAKGKFNLNARLRLEFVDQDGAPGITDPSIAPTLRTRFGYTTAPLYGFQAMLEGENVAVIGNDVNFNAAGSNGVGYKPAVADPPTTELNQAWVSYTYTNWFTVKAGRQRLALDNHRFIGDVAWRQNMQTFDAAGIESKPLRDLSIYYGYIWDVHRVFGDVSGLPAASRDFQSSSHLINVSYSGLPYGRLTAYTYLLDLENSTPGDPNSCATYGVSFAGNAPVGEKVTLGYRGELGWQTDYAGNAAAGGYHAEYYNVEVAATIKPISFGAGYEVLGTDNNQGFRTPLATLHAFNGWADVFLNTPGKGLRDIYGLAQVILPGQVPLRAIYHEFLADSGGADFGHEIDLQASKKFGKYWTALIKYAAYDGKSAPFAFDLQKFWAQVEFNF